MNTILNRFLDCVNRGKPTQIPDIHGKIAVARSDAKARVLGINLLVGRIYQANQQIDALSIRALRAPQQCKQLQPISSLLLMDVDEICQLLFHAIAKKAGSPSRRF